MRSTAGSKNGWRACPLACEQLGKGYGHSGGASLGPRREAFNRIAAISQCRCPQTGCGKKPVVNRSNRTFRATAGRRSKDIFVKTLLDPRRGAGCVSNAVALQIATSGLLTLGRLSGPYRDRFPDNRASSRILQSDTEVSVICCYLVRHPGLSFLSATTLCGWLRCHSNVARCRALGSSSKARRMP